MIRSAARLLVVLAVCGACAAPPPSFVPDGYELVYVQDFRHPDSLTEFDFTDAAAWSWSESEPALELLGDSDYRPPHRSPTSIALVRDLAVGAFVLEADMLQTGREYGHRDMCLFFGYESAARFYYVHLAPEPDDRAHNVFLVRDAERERVGEVAEAGMAWGDARWHRVRLEYDGREVRAFADGELTLRSKVAPYGPGRIGFGSFDDSGKIANVRIWTPSKVTGD